MKLVEIYTVGERDEYLFPHTLKFNRAKKVAKLNNFILRKKIDGDHIYYGVFNNKELIGMLWLTKRKDKFQVALIQIAQSHRGQGLGTFLIDYAVMNDNLTILSDNRQTLQAQKMWLHFTKIGHFKIYPYDLTDDKIANINIDQVYNNDQYVLIAIPPGKTINESLVEINQKYNGARKIYWYGNGGESFFNW